MMMVQSFPGSGAEGFGGHQRDEHVVGAQETKDNGEGQRTAGECGQASRNMGSIKGRKGHNAGFRKRSAT